VCVSSSFQEDNFVPTMTTWEVMSFYAEVGFFYNQLSCRGAALRLLNECLAHDLGTAAASRMHQGVAAEAPELCFGRRPLCRRLEGARPRGAPLRTAKQIARATPTEAASHRVVRARPPPTQIILPGKWSPQRRKDRIREVLSEVGLAHAHRTIVGGMLPGGLMMRGLSGGERKRLAIATGILAAPSVLFLDEPTSGLDSFAALTVGPGAGA
jgi:ABC-type dipeptide/oligopeptide/nickel transport system ATPase component